MKEDVRAILGRWLLIGSPCLAAAVTAGGFMLPDPVRSTLLSYPYEALVVTSNAALAMLGAGVNGYLLRGTIRDRVSRMLCCAGLGLILYFTALTALMLPAALGHYFDMFGAGARNSAVDVAK